MPDRSICPQRGHTDSWQWYPVFDDRSYEIGFRCAYSG